MRSYRIELCLLLAGLMFGVPVIVITTYPWTRLFKASPPGVQLFSLTDADGTIFQTHANAFTTFFEDECREAHKLTGPCTALMCLTDQTIPYGAYATAYNELYLDGNETVYGFDGTMVSPSIEAAFDIGLTRTLAMAGDPGTQFWTGCNVTGLPTKACWADGKGDQSTVGSTTLRSGFWDAGGLQSCASVLAGIMCVCHN
jgi:hypothetical protein